MEASSDQSKSHCPICIKEFSKLLLLVSKLGPKINLQTFPFGNAKMYTETNKTLVKCQFGEAECYGNKLHACAIDCLKHNTPVYVKYNACLMRNMSTDAAADECGKLQNIDSEPIKSCAKGSRGQELLVLCGQESRKVAYPGVPYVLVNGSPPLLRVLRAKYGKAELMEAVCDAFKVLPDECKYIFA